LLEEPPPVVEPAAEAAIEPVVERVVEPVVEPAPGPMAEPEAPPADTAMEPEPLAVAEAPPAILPEVAYGSSGVVEEVSPPDVAGFKKQKRGKRRKSGPNAPAPDRPPEDGSAS
jgi:hypothetical protein